VERWSQEVERWSLEYVDRNWTKARPVTLSFPDRVVVIGRGVETRRSHDKRELKRLWAKVGEQARDSATEVLADLLRTLDEATDPDLRDVAGKLERKSPRGREQIASRILAEYAVMKTGPQDYPEGKAGAILRQSVRYEIGRDRFVAALLDELGGSDGQYNRRNGSRSASTSAGRIVLSIVAVWLLVIGASSVLRAGAKRRLTD
jgi:hypothetical protein